MSGRIVYRIIWVPSLIILIGMLGFWTKRTTAVAAPEALEPFTSTDKTISIQHPRNWPAKEGGAHGVATTVAFVADRNAGVKVTADLGGSLVADINIAAQNMQSNAGDMAGASGAAGVPGLGASAEPRKTPLEKAHEAAGQALEADYEDQDYKEENKKKITIGGMEAMQSDFSYKMAKGGWGGSGEVVGKRATLLGPERAVTVVCYCPKESKEMLWPVFDKMIASLKTGQAGGQ